MELPFKYVVLYMFKILNDRNMSLSIGKSELIAFFKEFIKKAYLLTEDRMKVEKKFSLEYELDSFLSTYYQYFSVENKCIVFDKDYISELDYLLEEAGKEYEHIDVMTAVCVINTEIVFLEILGVNMNKDSYNYLLDIDKEIEKNYNLMSDLDNYVGLSEVDTKILTDNIKKLIFKRLILVMNTKTLLSDIEYYDLVNYSASIAAKNDNYEDFELLLRDECFGKEKIIYDVFKKSIFTSNELYFFSLREKLNMNLSSYQKNMKYSELKFYLTFLELLEEEIKKDSEISSELINIKYRLMYVIDTLYDTTVFMKRDVLDDVEFKERYDFIEYEIYYFINELLMYDDEQYKNKDFDTDNMMVYLDNTVKKLLIETYYKLTGSQKVIDTINGNKLYGVNKISTNYLRNIIEKPKIKIKEI